MIFEMRLYFFISMCKRTIKCKTIYLTIYLYQGHHLDHLFPKNISTCPNSMIKEAIDLFMDKRNENIPSQTCERIEYTGFH